MCVPGIGNIPYVGDLYRYVETLRRPLENCYEKIQVSGETQNRFLAALRTTIGIASVHLDPLSAMVGNALTIALPSNARTIISKSDDMLTGLWNGMTPNQRLAATIAGIIVTYYGVPYLWIPAAICSAKVGAQLSLDNVNKEIEASVIRKATENVQKY
jgi:hypothetical protein